MDESDLTSLVNKYGDLIRESDQLYEQISKTLEEELFKFIDSEINPILPEGYKIPSENCHVAGSNIEREGYGFSFYISRFIPGFEYGHPLEGDHDTVTLSGSNLSKKILDQVEEKFAEYAERTGWFNGCRV